MNATATHRAYHAIVHGLVQGVSFRKFTNQEAARLGLSGFVRNLPDGTVETFFQGKGDAAEELAAWLEHGPTRARVDKLDLKAADPRETYKGFAITR